MIQPGPDWDGTVAHHRNLRSTDLCLEQIFYVSVTVTLKDDLDLDRWTLNILLEA